MKASEIVVFVLYLIFMLSIGVYFFVKNKSGGEKTYVLGGRQMGPWVTAMSAQAAMKTAFWPMRPLRFLDVARSATIRSFFQGCPCGVRPV